jgi:pimeloyl-ACP methyl ester carboxylesterase
MTGAVTADMLPGVPRGAPVDGFRLAYDRAGAGPPVVLLHGWPGSRQDYRDVVPLLTGAADVVVPDLRGFGDSDRHDEPAADAYSAAAQAASVLGLVDELGLERPVLVGYDVGSRVAQTAARLRPDAVRALVLSPPLPGVGERVLEPAAQREFWYQPFHRLELAGELIDGRPPAVRAYLRHFWDHWSAPGWSPAPQDFDALVALYARPGAFAASIAWYRAGSGTVAVARTERAPAAHERLSTPTTVLWGAHDPLFPAEWSDRLDEFFVRAESRVLADAGHFMPLEAPDAIAAAALAHTAA